MFSQNFKKIKIGRALFFALTIFIGLSLAPKVEAASLSLSPSSSSYFQNKQFVVTVYVNSDQQSLNAVAGTISFPQDKLEVVSVSKSGTIFNFWVQEPSFSNASGKVSFEGVVLNPGFKGSGGKLISISFKAKAPGDAKLSFSSASILANDGKGTNILTGTGAASFSIKKIVETEENDSNIVKEAENLLLPVKATTEKDNFLAPAIRSSSHPDNSAWYSTATAVFHWDIPKDAKSLLLLLSAEANSSPAVNYSPPIGDKVIKDLEDGVWYLHASFKYDKGISAVTHFPVRIDTAPPENLSIAPITPKDSNQKNEALQFLLAAEDKLSGLDYYEIAFDQQTPFRWNLDQGNIIDVPALAGGEHEVYLTAVDKAGNRSSVKQTFSVKSANTPLINHYPSDLSSEEAFVLSGQALPSSLVQINLSRAGGLQYVYIVPTNESGHFIFILERMIPGSYQFNVQSLDENGLTPATTNFRFSVQTPVNYWPWSLLILIISLSINIFVLIRYFLSRCRLFKKSIISPSLSSRYRAAPRKRPALAVKAKKRRV